MLAAIRIFCIQDFVQYKISAKLTEIALKANYIENMGHGDCKKIALYSVENCILILFPFDFSKNFHNTNRVIGSLEKLLLSFCVFFLYRNRYIYYNICLFRFGYKKKQSMSFLSITTLIQRIYAARDKGKKV